MTGAQDTSKKVLVADDSPAIRTLAESILRQAGHDVFTVGSGADALEWIRSRQPDLVLLDLSLPDLDGGKVCELLKSDSSLQRIFILILLNTNEIKRRKELKTLGADGFVVKPFIPKDLINQVESLLKGKTETEIKIVSNQGEPESKSTPTEPHNYEWFMSEMKKETEDKSSQASSKDESPQAEKDSPQEDGIEYETKDVSSQRDGYENFISQFKEEIKVEGSHEPLVYGELKVDEEVEPTTKIKTLKEKPAVKREGKEITLDPERVTKELIHEVASRIAQEIVENLDKDTLHDLIRKKIKEFKV